MIGCTEDNTITSILTHEINRCTLQTLYNDTITGLLTYKHETAIVETDILKVFIDESGKNLELLKIY